MGNIASSLSPTFGLSSPSSSSSPKSKRQQQHPMSFPGSTLLLDNPLCGSLRDTLASPVHRQDENEEDGDHPSSSNNNSNNNRKNSFGGFLRHQADNLCLSGDQEEGNDNHNNYAHNSFFADDIRDDNSIADRQASRSGGATATDTTNNANPTSALFARALVSEVTNNPNTMTPKMMAEREKRLLKAQEAARKQQQQLLHQQHHNYGNSTMNANQNGNANPNPITAMGKPVGAPGGVGQPTFLGSIAYVLGATASPTNSDTDGHNASNHDKTSILPPNSIQENRAQATSNHNHNNNNSFSSNSSSSASKYSVTIGLSLSRRHSTLGHPDTITRQTAFDFNELQDRQYKYVSSTDSSGWMAGGGERGGSFMMVSASSADFSNGDLDASPTPQPPPPAGAPVNNNNNNNMSTTPKGASTPTQQQLKIAAPDTVHIPIIQIDADSAAAVDAIIGALARGEVFIPHMAVLPESLSVNGISPPDLVVRFGCERNDDVPPEEWPNWCLEFMHNQLYEYFLHLGARWTKRPFHITLAKKVRWKTVKHMNRYFAHAERVIDAWREKGPQYLDPQLSYIEGGATPEEVARPHGIYLLRNGVPTNYFPPNFDPPYTTKMTRSLLLNVLGKSWNKQRREWSSEPIPRLVTPAVLMASMCGCADPAPGFLATEVTQVSFGTKNNSSSTLPPPQPQYPQPLHQQQPYYQSHMMAAAEQHQRAVTAATGTGGGGGGGAAPSTDNNGNNTTTTSAANSSNNNNNSDTFVNMQGDAVYSPLLQQQQQQQQHVPSPSQPQEVTTATVAGGEPNHPAVAKSPRQATGVVVATSPAYRPSHVAGQEQDGPVGYSTAAATTTTTTTTLARGKDISPLTASMMMLQSPMGGEGSVVSPFGQGFIDDDDDGDDDAGTNRGEAYPFPEDGTNGNNNNIREEKKMEDEEPWNSHLMTNAKQQQQQQQQQRSVQEDDYASTNPSPTTQSGKTGVVGTDPSGLNHSHMEEDVTEGSKATNTSILINPVENKHFGTPKRGPTPEHLRVRPPETTTATGTMTTTMPNEMATSLDDPAMSPGLMTESDDDDESGAFFHEQLTTPKSELPGMPLIQAAAAGQATGDIYELNSTTASSSTVAHLNLSPSKLVQRGYERKMAREGKLMSADSAGVSSPSSRSERRTRKDKETIERERNLHIAMIAIAQDSTQKTHDHIQKYLKDPRKVELARALMEAEKARSPQRLEKHSPSRNSASPSLQRANSGISLDYSIDSSLLGDGSTTLAGSVLATDASVGTANSRRTQKSAGTAGSKTNHHNKKVAEDDDGSTSLQESYSESVEPVPNDEDLFAIGWAKALDVKSGSYYYFTLDRSKIVWDNPLAPPTIGSGGSADSLSLPPGSAMI